MTEMQKALLVWLSVMVLLVFLLLAPAFAGSLWFIETQTVLAASATFTGSTHDTGPAAPAYSYFGCSFLTDQAGTAYVDDSVDDTNWHIALTAAIVANTRLDLNSHLRARYVRCREVNGSTLQTANYVVSSFTTD